MNKNNDYFTARHQALARHLCQVKRHERERIIGRVSGDQAQGRVRERYYFERATLISGLPVNLHEKYLSRVHTSEREHVERHLIAIAQGKDSDSKNQIAA